MDNIKNQFELWCRNNPLKTDKDKKGNYKYQSTHLAFMAWQASRKALVVELPTAFPVSDDKDSAEVAYVLDILEKLALAGVSYK